jgi:hypothetical protein
MTASYNDTELFFASKNPAKISGDELTSLVQSWITLSRDVAEPLEIAVHRLAQGLRRSKPVDRALDLGIALEVLLLHGTESTTELSFRFAVHGANFVGGAKEVRLENQKLLKGMYTLRSDAAHAGRLKAKTSAKEREAEQIMERAGALASGVAKKIILRKSFPNWNEEFVIAGD